MTKQEALTLAVELIKNSDIAPENKANAAMDIADKFVEYVGVTEDIKYVPYYPYYPTYPTYPIEPYYYNPTCTSDTNIKAF